MTLRGMIYAATQADEAVILHATWAVNSRRDRRRNPQPFDLASPWNLDPNADLTPADRAELEARLNSVSAFPDA